MGIPDCDPVLRSFISLTANFKAIIPLLGSHVTTVNGIHQQGFQIGFIPYIFPIFRVFLISQWWNNACKLALGCLQVIGRMDFLGNISGIHPIQYILKRSNLIVPVKGIHIVV